MLIVIELTHIGIIKMLVLARYSPAKASLYKMLAKFLPQEEKTTKKKQLTMHENSIALPIFWRIVSVEDVKALLAISGIRTTPSEPTMLDGVKMSGITIPLALPNWAVASGVLNPHLVVSNMGIHSDKKVDISEPKMRVIVSGVDDLTTLAT